MTPTLRLSGIEVDHDKNFFTVDYKVTIFCLAVFGSENEVECNGTVPLLKMIPVFG